jgi:glycosyltransferase involved in cell wall biosynthesis
MHILINTASTHKGGGVQVAKSFIEECKAYPLHQFTVILGLGLYSLIDTTLFPKNFSFYYIPYRPATLVFTFKDQAAFLKKVEKEVKPDVVFTTSGPAYWKPKAPHLMGYNLPHYIYKDSPFFKLLTFHQKVKWKLKGEVIKYFTKRDAQAYVVQTEDVNARLRKWIDAKNVITVTNTYGSQYNNKGTSQKLLPEKKSEEYRLLLLSGYYTHKNIELINKIVPLLIKQGDSDVKFVLSLPEEDYKKIIEQNVREHVINIGPVRPEDCPKLYKECDAVFLPTLLECFSATYAEAMKMKLPIITTNLGFAKTVCGKAALYFEPLNAVDASEKILQLKNTPSLKNKLLNAAESEIEKFNSATQRAALYLHICEKIMYKQ